MKEQVRIILAETYPSVEASLRKPYINSSESRLGIPLITWLREKYVSDDLLQIEWSARPDDLFLQLSYTFSSREALIMFLLRYT